MSAESFLEVCAGVLILALAAGIFVFAFLLWKMISDLFRTPDVRRYDFTDLKKQNLSDRWG